MASNEHPRAGEAPDDHRPTKILRQMDAAAIYMLPTPTAQLPGSQSRLVCFTDLPGEIRNEVYEYVLLLREPSKWLKRSNTVVIDIESDRQPNWQQVPTARALLEVNKQVRRESMDFWYHNAVFRIMYYNIPSVRSWLNSLKEDGLTSLERIELGYMTRNGHRYACSLFLQYQYPFRHAKCHRIARLASGMTARVDRFTQTRMANVFHNIGPVERLTSRYICLLVASYFYLACQRHGICLPQQRFQDLSVDFVEIFRLVEKGEK